MKIVEIILLGFCLAMDAFAVSICKGLSMKRMSWKNALIIALYFGTFQAIMPIIGCELCNNFEDVVIKFNHWIAFILLGSIGMNMIKEAVTKDGTEECNDRVDFKTMILLALATSIDALAVGVTFAALEVNVSLAVTIVGVITFCLCFFGVKIGNTFGHKFEARAQVWGGILLILLGTKILLEHLGFIHF